MSSFFGLGVREESVRVDSATVKNGGPDRLYYSARNGVSASQNDGHLDIGQSIILEGNQFMVSTGLSQVAIVEDGSIDPSGAQGGQGPPGPPGPAGVVNAGRVVDPFNLGTAGTITLTSADDQGSVDASITLTAPGGVLTIDGVQTVTRCRIWLIVYQDATGNRTLDVKNTANSVITSVAVDMTANPVGTDTPIGTLILLYTTNGHDLAVIGPNATSSGGGGSGASTGGMAKPTVTGTLGVGNVLTATPDPNYTNVTYQWRRSLDAGTTFSDIAGETNATYTQALADQGTDKRVLVKTTGTPLALSDPVVVPSPDIAFVATAQQTTGTSTALHVLRPTGATDGDVLFVAITVPTGGTTTVGLPATTGGTDWAPMGSGANQTANGVSATGRYQESSGVLQFLYWKRLAAGDATTTWSFTANASVSYRSRTVAFRNVHATGTPFEAFTQAFGGASTTVSVPSVTPGAAGRMQVVVVSFAGATDITWPASAPTLTETEGSDYQKFGYNFLGASTSATTAFTGTASAAVHKSVAEFLVIP